MTSLLLICIVLMLVSGAWVLLPRAAWRGLAAQWRRLPRKDMMVMVLLLAAGTWYGADKGYVARSKRVAQLLTVMSSGELRGPTNVIASAVAGAAVQAVLDESSSMLASASNAVAWCWAEIPDLEWAITNTSISYLQCEIPAPLTTPNPVARADMLQVAEGTNGLRHVMVAFSVVPSSAPVVQFYADERICEAVSNSFPATVDIETPSGTAPCYVYTVRVPGDLSGVVLLPEREITFGGGPDNEPLAVLGSLMINDKLGFTGERLIATGVVGVFEGGILIEVRDAE